MDKFYRKSMAWMLAVMLILSGVGGTIAVFGETNPDAPATQVRDETNPTAPNAPEGTNAVEWPEGTNTPNEAAVPDGQPQNDAVQAAQTKDEENGAGAGYFSVAITDENGAPITMRGPNDEATFVLLDSPDFPARDHIVSGFAHFGFWSYADGNADTDVRDAGADAGAGAGNPGPAYTFGPVRAGTYWVMAKTSPGGYELPEENLFPVTVLPENTAGDPVALTVAYPVFQKEIPLRQEPSGDGGISLLAVYSYHVARASGSPIGRLADGTPVWLHTITPPGTDTNTGGTIAYCANHGSANPSWSRYNYAGGASQGDILSAIVGTNSPDYVSQQGAYWIALGQYAYGLDGGADAMYDAAVATVAGITGGSGNGGSGTLPGVTIDGEAAVNNAVFRPTATVTAIGGGNYSRYGPISVSDATKITSAPFANPAYFYGDADGNGLDPANLPAAFYIFVPATEVFSGNAGVTLKFYYPRAVTVAGSSSAYTGAGTQTLATASGSYTSYDPTGNEGEITFQLEQYNHGLLVIDKRDGRHSHAGLEGAQWQIQEWSGSTWQGTAYQMHWNGAARTYTSDMLWENSYNGGHFRLIELAAPYSYTGANLIDYQFRLPPLGNLESLTADSLNNTPVFAVIRLQKVDKNTGTAVSQGDATLTGAKYQLFYNETRQHPDGTTFAAGTPVRIDAAGIQRADGIPYIVTTDAAGKTEFRSLFPMKYYIKELPSGTSGADAVTGSRGYLLDPSTYEVDTTCLPADPVSVTKNITVNEQVKKQGFDIVKLSGNDRSEYPPLKNAGFTVYLVSSLSGVKSGSLAKPAGGWTSADLSGIDYSAETAAMIDGVIQPEFFTGADGRLQFPEYPYGVYVAVETTVPAGYKPIAPFIVTVDEDSRVHQPWRYFVDTDKFWVRIVKKDAGTGNVVLGKNAAYRLFSLTENKYVEMLVSYPVPITYGTIEHPFETGEDGRLILPQTLKYGTYRLEEVTAPEGYVLAGREQTDLPVYNLTGAGAPNPSSDVILDFTGLIYDEDIRDDVIEVVQKNEQQKGHINLLKEKEDPLDSGNSGNPANPGVPPSGKLPMAGVEFRLYAAEDIFAQDGSGTILYEKDTLAYSMTTNADGKAAISNILLGKYVLREYAVGETDQAEIGGVLRSRYDFADGIEIEFTPQDQDVAVVFDNRTLLDVYRLGKITIEKTGEQPEGIDEPLEGVVFEVIARDDIYDELTGEKVWGKSDVAGTIITDENGEATLDDLLPGDYTLREIEAPEDYLLVPDRDFTIADRGETDPFEFYTWDILDKRKGLLIAVEVDKDTIKRTSAAFVSLEGQRGNHNVGKEDERYRYNVDFRSTSNVTADEFVVDDNLENAREELVCVEELWTPIVWGDSNGKWNLWYKTNRTDDHAVYSEVSAYDPAFANPYDPDHSTVIYPNTGFRLWAQNLNTGERYHFLVSDLPLAEGEYLTALRFEYGHVEVGFTSKNYAARSQDGEHRGEAKGPVDLGEDTARLDLLDGTGETGSSIQERGSLGILKALGILSVFGADTSSSANAEQTRTRTRTEGSLTEDRVDWTPDPAQAFYPPDPADGARLEAAALLPASYLVSAVRPMADINIVSSVSARIARQTSAETLRDYDQDAVVTKELVTFTVADQTFAPGSADEDSLLGKLGRAAATADDFRFAEWSLMLFAAALGFAILLLLRKLRRERNSCHV